MSGMVLLIIIVKETMKKTEPDVAVHVRVFESYSQSNCCLFIVNSRGSKSDFFDIFLCFFWFCFHEELQISLGNI